MPVVLPLQAPYIGLIAPPLPSKDATERGFGLPLSCEGPIMSASPDIVSFTRTRGPERAVVERAAARAPERCGEDPETARTTFRNALMTWANEGGAR